MFWWLYHKVKVDPSLSITSKVITSFKPKKSELNGILKKVVMKFLFSHSMVVIKAENRLRISRFYEIFFFSYLIQRCLHFFSLWTTVEMTWSKWSTCIKKNAEYRYVLSILYICNRCSHTLLHCMNPYNTMQQYIYGHYLPKLG